MSPRLVVAQILGAHGVHGRVKLKSFTAEPEAVFEYAPLTDEAGGRVFALRRTGTGKDHFLVEIDGVRSKEAADDLKGVKLCIARDRLPKPDEDEEFYHADLIGLPALTTDGTEFGAVVAIFDFGAGDVLEIAHVSGKTVHLPFTKAAVPTVDITGGRIVVAPPENLFASAGPPPTEEELAGEIEVELEDGASEDGPEQPDSR